MSSYDPATDHPSFEEDHIHSVDAVFVAIKWMHFRNETVLIPGFEQRDDVEERYDYQDDGDFFLVQNENLVRVEVKQRSLEFSSPEDYGYETVFLNEKYKHEKAPPAFYLIFSNSLRHCAVVKANSEDAWEVEYNYDTEKNRKAKFYAAPLDVCTFKEVPRHILQ